nr:MAG TPA: hypothetical protein [Caudoviricetes sp.]
MTLLDMLDKTVRKQNVQIFASDTSVLLFKGTVEDACRAKHIVNIRTCRVEFYTYDTSVLNIYVEMPETSEHEETVTVVDNRKLRKIIHEVTTSCFLTKKEYAQIAGVIYNACDRALREAKEEAKKRQ